jgi:hypothetical protein
MGSGAGASETERHAACRHDVLDVGAHKPPLAA